MILITKKYELCSWLNCFYGWGIIINDTFKNNTHPYKQSYMCIYDTYMCVYDTYMYIWSYVLLLFITIVLLYHYLHVVL